ncbi:MAG: response regulator [Acidobacteriota bacterium]
MRSTLPNNVDVQLELDPDLPPIEAQVTQIQQVVMNLLLNAAEALEGESGTVVARTELRRLRPNQRLRVGFPGFIGEAPAPGDYVRLLVSDGGCGMDSATVEKIFDPFFTTKLTGRGLGLAAVLGIVRGHQGGISIRSEVGSGSAIEVYFPAMRGAETRGCEAEIRRHQREELAYRQPRVLVVDDEEVVRLIASEMLEFLECEVLLAADGPEALEIFEREGGDLDLVVLDVTMPAMSGEELLIRLRERSAMLPVLVASGFTKEDLSCRFASYDVSGFIHKPYKLDELKDLVDRALLA